MPIERDDAGAWDSTPSEVKAEIAHTNAVFQTINMDVEKANVNEAFKKEWRTLYLAWAKYSVSHSGFIDSLRDEVYRRAQSFRGEAERFRSVLVKIGKPITPLPDRTAYDKLKDEKKEGESSFLAWLIGVPTGLVIFRWLWKKAGEDKQKLVLQDSEGNEFELPEEAA